MTLTRIKRVLRRQVKRQRDTAAQQAWLHLLSEQSRQELLLTMAQDPLFQAAAPGNAAGLAEH